MEHTLLLEKGHLVCPNAAMNLHLLHIDQHVESYLHSVFCIRIYNTLNTSY